MANCRFIYGSINAKTTLTALEKLKLTVLSPADFKDFVPHNLLDQIDALFPDGITDPEIRTALQGLHDKIQSLLMKHRRQVESDQEMLKNDLKRCRAMISGEKKYDISRLTTMMEFWSFKYPSLIEADKKDIIFWIKDYFFGLGILIKQYTSHSSKPTTPLLVAQTNTPTLDQQAAIDRQAETLTEENSSSANTSEKEKNFSSSSQEIDLSHQAMKLELNDEEVPETEKKYLDKKRRERKEVSPKNVSLNVEKSPDRGKLIPRIIFWETIVTEKNQAKKEPSSPKPQH